MCLILRQSEIKLISATVFVDPYEEADAKVSLFLIVYTFYNQSKGILLCILPIHR